VNVFHLADVTKHYGRETRANDAISFDVEAGEVFGILGANGAGKTTLVEQMVGVLRPSSGSISLFGRDVHADRAVVPAHVGFMPQTAFALNSLTVAEAVYISAHLRGLPRADARAARDAVIDRLGLGAVSGRVARQLSGGQRRLLSLGTALVADPPVLILDEPTSELDPVNRRLVWDVLRERCERDGATVIFITHDALEAEKLIQRVAIMRDGRVLALGRPSELKARVDRLLRLEVTGTPGQAPPVPSLEWERVDAERWRAYVESAAAAETVNLLQAAALDDFRLASPTLEDLYLHYVAGD
jgi:ABC-2 type transport system ATP-binding protein